jgi:hypothetical protein
MSDEKPIKLTLFHSLTCGHCHTFMPVWDEMKGDKNKNILENMSFKEYESSVIENLPEDVKTINGEDVRSFGYPSIKISINKNDYEYSGRRTPQAIYQFILDNIKENSKGHSDKKHSDKKHSDKGHSDKGHSDKGHSDKGHSDKGHSDKGHSDKGHSDKGHSDKGHSDKKHNTHDLTSSVSSKDTKASISESEQNKFHGGFNTNSSKIFTRMIRDDDFKFLNEITQFSEVAKII